MARRRKSARRAPRRSFARAARTVSRVVRRKARRSYSRGRSSGWLPLSGREMMVSVGTGAVTPIANNLVAPYVDPYLGFAGQYKDEVRTALIGVVAHKFGSGLIKDAGREMTRQALFSTGASLGSSLGIGTSNGTAAGGYL